MYRVQQSTTSNASDLCFLMVQSSDHVSALTGASPTVTIRKPGGAFGSPSGAVSEIANGWYRVAGNSTDNATLGSLLLHATAASGDPTDVAYEVVAQDLTTATVARVTLTDTVTTYTGNTPQTGDSFARIGVAGAGLTNIDLPNQTMDITGNITGSLSGSVGSVTGSVASVTGAVGSVTATVNADVKKINATTVNGDGSVGNPWGP